MPSDDEARTRDRSASPSREAKKPKTSTKGFKWKEKRPRDEDSESKNGAGRLERGYRDRSPRRDTYRDREREGTSRRDGDDDRNRDRERSPRRRDGGDSYRPGRDDEDRKKEDDTIAEAPSSGKPVKEKKKEKKEKKPKQITSSEPMIVVNVNDRLGTKAGIPCLASDSVKAFKAMVAAHIGRQPHEIMLKRQGERPFKDQLTLADYGVSNGVQLDLELDTGD